MSLYHEAAAILDTVAKGQTSLKTEVFGKKGWKSDQKTLFALCSEAAKWSAVLKELVEKSGVLGLERTLSPTLALVLSHDLLLSKRGVALPAKHGLHLAIARHKARLAAELTKVRLKKGFPTLEALREDVNRQANEGEDGAKRPQHPRWIRINTLRTTLDEQLASTFRDFERVKTVGEVSRSGAKALYLDEHVPDLVAISPSISLASSPAYREGKLIFQDKASCFPAYLLNPTGEDGDVIDATAAPGNKTTHLAAISRAAKGDSAKVFACEKDETRSKTLLKMTRLADPEGIIVVKAKQNFMKLSPSSKQFENVTAILLDPSCSGSGIVGRDEGGVTVHLPSTTAAEPARTNGKKRKRAAEKPQPQPEVVEETPAVEEETEEIATKDAAELHRRLTALSEFQLRMVEHAMSFPAARRITYSTCSIHSQENEGVVVQALMSDAARSGGWRIMRRDEQVDGMRRWHRRGDIDATKSAVSVADDEAAIDTGQVAKACIRCEKSSEDGTMGFFVAGFVRDAALQNDHADDQDLQRPQSGDPNTHDSEDAEEDEEWGGFSDGD